LRSSHGGTGQGCLHGQVFTDTSTESWAVLRPALPLGHTLNSKVWYQASGALSLSWKLWMPLIRSSGFTKVWWVDGWVLAEHQALLGHVYVFHALKGASVHLVLLTSI
jgi:hypothetical protein